MVPRPCLEWLSSSLFWVLLGLGLFFVAIRGGTRRRPQARRDAGPRRTQGYQRVFRRRIRRVRGRDPAADPHGQPRERQQAQVGRVKLNPAEAQGRRAVRPALRRLPHARRRQRHRQGRAQPRQLQPPATLVCTPSSTAACRTRHRGSAQTCLGYGTMPALSSRPQDAPGGGVRGQGRRQGIGGLLAGARPSGASIWSRC